MRKQPRFRKKAGLLGLIFFSRLPEIFTQNLTFSESSGKIKVMSSLTHFVILLTSVVIYRDFCMETRLYNICKTTNAMTLNKTILESTYKVLQSSLKKTILKQPVQFSKAVQFKATFNV